MKQIKKHVKNVIFFTSLGAIVWACGKPEDTTKDNNPAPKDSTKDNPCAQINTNLAAGRTAEANLENQTRTTLLATESRKFWAIFNGERYNFFTDSVEAALAAARILGIKDTALYIDYQNKVAEVVGLIADSTECVNIPR